MVERWLASIPLPEGSDKPSIPMGVLGEPMGDYPSTNSTVEAAAITDYEALVGLKFDWPRLLSPKGPKYPNRRYIGFLYYES